MEPIILNLPSLPLIDELRPHISTSSIGLILKNISWNKSPGASGLTYDILKIAPLQVLLTQSRSSLNFYCYTEVCPIKLEALANCPRAEEGDLNLIKNYRPISLTEPSQTDGTLPAQIC